MESIEQQRRMELARLLHDKMYAYMYKVDIREFLKWKESSIAKIQSLYTNPVEREKYMLWHVLIGGTGYNNCLNFDFEGEASIQKMIECLEV